MNKVITINLAGRAYSVEEPGYVLLKNYLDKAAAKLADNPDKDEILKDFNLAIAEKCEAYLSSSKNVVLTADIEKILKEMGPVEGADDAKAQAHAHANANTDGKTNEQNGDGTKTKKKLYLLDDKGVGIICGVCSGLAAYFDIDVTIVRVIFVALGLITHGLWILVYFIMAWIIPEANTPEEKARAWGTAQMTAQDFMNKAKTGYENFKNSDEWKKWKNQMKEEGTKWKHQRRQWKHSHNYNYSRNYGRSPVSEFLHGMMGLLWFAFILYISWYGYNHITVVHNFFDLIGNLIQQVINKISAKI